MEAAFSTFECVRIRVEIRARSMIHLPSYKGSALRGALGVALKQLCCAARQRCCEECLLRAGCLYVYFFETPLSGDDPEGARYRHAPHPFVLQIERDGPVTLEPGDRWSFDMTVVGRAARWLPYLAAAFQRMGELGVGKGRGKFDLDRITFLDGFGQPGEALFRDGMLNLPSTRLKADVSLCAPLNGSGNLFRLRFLTPLRMVFRGDLVRKPEFHILAGTLARRVENLVRFHCGEAAPLDVQKIIERAKSVDLVEDHTRWYDWERYSHRQRRRMRLGGLVGEAVYRGDPALFEPLLTLGTWVHVGKATSFGLGRYEII